MSWAIASSPVTVNTLPTPPPNSTRCPLPTGTYAIDVLGYSKDVILYIILRKQVISLSKIKTLNDFKLLQLSWIYDLNFKPSFRLLQKRDYIARIISQLPQTEEIHKVFVFLKDYVNQRLKDY